MRDRGKSLDSRESQKDVLEDDEAEEDRNCYEGLKRNIRDFLENSTLHGLKYLADEKITIFERSFFGLSFVFVILCSAFFISNVYAKWKATPIIITTSPQPTFITNIPFPAVTICSLNQALKSRVKHIAKSSQNYTLLMSLCAKDSEDDQRIDQLTWKNFRILLKEVSQPCQEMLAYCRFGSNTEECENIFNPVLTDDGLCCIFNSVDPRFLLRNYTEDDHLSQTSDDEYVPIDWTPEMGYENNLPPKFYPRITAGTGSRMGLTVILNASSSEYFCSTSKSIGFKILVHNPAEEPKIGNYGFLVTSGRENRVSIDPRYQTAVPAIRSISSDIRQCLFSDEGDLTYYRTYSRKNCELECEARILSENCDCVLYYLPRIDPETKICGPKDNRCTKRVQNEIQSSSGNYSCENCMPACFELNYSPTVTASQMVDGDFMTNEEYPHELFENINDITIVHFYYLSNVFRSTTKGEMFGFTEFLSNTGGLLGLFMGFSVFSVIEILYFIVLRPNCDHRVKRKQKKRAERSMRNKNVWMTPVKGRRPLSGYISTKKLRQGQWHLRNVFNHRSGADETEVFPYLN